MITTRKLQVIALLSVFLFSVPVVAEDVCVKSPFEFDVCDWHGRFSGSFSAPDIFYIKNGKLLNHNSQFDEILYARHKIDLNFDLSTGQDTYGFDVATFRASARNKGVWGNRNSIAGTTEVSASLLDHTMTEHNHAIPRHIFWLREVWLQFAWNTPLGLGFCNPQYLRFGAFPFELGRGISLGSNYATGPSVIAFFDDGSVDQYAFGFQLFGEIVKDWISYDLYLGILENKASALSDTKEKIYTNAFDADKPHPNNRRGFGRINVVLASRLNITAWDNCGMGKFTLEPYALYNVDPEQKLEFVGDASSKLGTLGIAAEWQCGWFEGGFEIAKNLGRQKVRGWDRNIIEIQNRNGALTFVNSHVLTGVDPLDTTITVPSDLTAFKVTHDPNGTVGAQVQTIIQNASQDADLNGALIGDVSPGVILNAPTAIGTATAGELYNDVNRFRDPYKNSYRGWMVIGDMAAWLIESELRLAATAGVASGDENPNLDLTNPNSSNVDSTFDGFLGLQQSYTGDRVRSAFVLGSAGKLVRPLSAPESNEVQNTFATTVTEFTNLILAGGSLKWEPSCYCYRFALHPNILFYWQEHATKKFDTTTGLSSPTEFASKYLGAEINLFFDVDLLDDLKLEFSTAVFVPGTHFDDIKGQPVKSDELIGTDVAYSVNINMVYKF